MKNILIINLIAAGLAAEKAFATPAPMVPEVDGGVAGLDIGLTAGLVALIRARAKKK